MLGISPLLVCLGASGAILWVFFHQVDLKPKVEETFFFSQHDPQLNADNEIHRMFPGSSQIILVATGDIRSSGYVERVQALSDELGRLPGVTSLQSLSRGPKSIDDALKSPLWSRLLIADNDKSTYIFVTWENTPDEATIAKVEGLQRRFNSPSFKLVVSGVPYISELIARNLAKDLRVFSLAAVCVFGIVLFIIFRSPWILLGTFIACADSGASTLIATQLIHIPIGPLTANLSTMVFVMTLSPMVFLTFNWRRIRKDEESKGLKAVWMAVKRTVAPSFWSAICMFLGFISLLFVPSTPMKHLGIAGAIGATMALVFAYTIYPWFLEYANVSRNEMHLAGGVEFRLRSFFSKRHGLIAAAIAVFTVIGAYGLRTLNTDPALPTYFKEGGDIRTGLDFVDKTGGSSPLRLVVEDQNRTPLDTGDAYKRLWGLQEALEKDPAVGNVLSLPLVLGEVKRRWYSFLFSTEKEIKVLDEPKHGKIASHFITPDRTATQFILRMRETQRRTPRHEVIGRLEKIVRRDGFRIVLMGGAYSLMDQTAKLVTSSIITGVLLLIGLFGLMGLVFSRSFRVGLAMLLTLITIPVIVRGYIAYLGMPLDFITASAANLDLGMGVDAMIYLTMFARCEAADRGTWTAWSKACSHLWQPIGTSLLVICCGFGIFLLSNFPPTQRFGLFVMFGSATAASAALFMFPWLASSSVLIKKGTRFPGSNKKDPPARVASD
ncbi:MAG: MMPL family transporter [Acidobacteriia bacterium]|nr:MMPL family transporter [Terriglobia bacterium]